MVGWLSKGFLHAAAAVFLALTVFLLLSTAAHAHSEPVVDVQLRLGDAGSDNEIEEDWTYGHCHGGPSCTGALFLSEAIRPERIIRRSLTKCFVAKQQLAGQLPARDPPVPIDLH